MSAKQQLIEQLLIQLNANYQVALSAAKRAHSTATDKQNIAENKYDTLGLEASYLAQGQAKRVAECSAELAAVKKLPTVDYLLGDAIELGALVNLVDQLEQPLLLFLAPVAGGLKFVFEQKNILVITPSSPLGKKLLGKNIGDEFEFSMGQHIKSYRIISID